jgi:hypothetical protein
MTLQGGKMKILISVILLLCLITGFNMVMLVTPVSIVDKERIMKDRVIAAYHISEKMAQAIYNAHVVSGFDPRFIAELVKSESGFKLNAVSSKGYKGVMQTPTATGDADADMVHGVKILMAKFKEANGDTLKAVAMYKGGLNTTAYAQARQFLSSYDKKYKGGI